VLEGEAAAAAGDLAAAATAFRGAAFLDPDDAAALAQLGLVLEAMDDPGATRAFRAAWAAVDRRPAGELEAALGGFGATALVRLLAEKLEGRG
jgi:Flp pilus assembly protein TadD